MTEEFSKFLIKHKPEIAAGELGTLVCREVVEKELLDELHDLFYKFDATLSTDAVIELLSDYYIRDALYIAPAEKKKIALNAKYLINKQLLSFFKTIRKENQVCD